MKATLLVLLSLSFSTLFSQKITPLDSMLWLTNYESAMANAKENNKPIILVFSGSDWCKPCIKLRENILVSQEFSNWAKENAVLLSLDFPRQKKNALPEAQVAHNEKMAEKFNKNGVFPIVIIIDQNEKVLGQLNYMDITPEEYIKKMEEILSTK
ncbi:MAG: thioredoxin family protein [Bacteroidetes bacterium HGW-Bacteroidetes-21]|jgi:thioredoxin-related protein|nr:MAG: thioredoxin family protein [Bacteroidetes bacterium HGW-Bacteroidetes-21]